MCSRTRSNPAPLERVQPGVDQRHVPGLHVVLVNFHLVVFHVEGHVRAEQEVVGKVFFDDVPLVPTADDKVVDCRARSKSS